MKNSLEEIIALSEAKGFYNLLSEDDKKKIPKLLVHKMIKYSDRKVTEKVQKMEDLNKNKISREGAKKIAYMSLFI